MYINIYIYFLICWLQQRYCCSEHSVRHFPFPLSKFIVDVGGSIPGPACHPSQLVSWSLKGNVARNNPLQNSDSTGFLLVVSSVIIYNHHVVTGINKYLQPCNFNSNFFQAFSNQMHTLLQFCTQWVMERHERH